MRRLILAAALMLLPMAQAHAWGGTAHEAICEIAFQELTPEARQRVVELIQRDAEFNLFRASCNFADRPRKRAPEHFVNLPRDASGIGTDPCPLAEKCVVSAIQDDMAILASAGATDDQKLEALKLVGHWVGDVHQPMHVSFEDDRGGNDIRAQGTACDNLHAVWDSCIVEGRLGTDAVAIADELRATVTEAQRTGWQSSNVTDW